MSKLQKLLVKYKKYMEIKNTILGTLTVILGVAIFSCLAPNLKDKAPPKLDPTIKTINLSSEIGLDTITSIGIQELGLKDLKIIIVNLTPEQIEEDESLLAYIEDYQTYFLIKVKPGLYMDYYLTILSHELHHLSDMHTGRLKQLYYGFWYDGVVYPFYWPYFDRKFEEEAFNSEMDLEIKIRHKMNNPTSGN